MNKPTATILKVGDKLSAEGSWLTLTETVVAIENDQAITNNGYRFRREFSDGSSCLNHDGGFMLDFRNWYLYIPNVETTELKPVRRLKSYPYTIY